MRNISKKTSAALALAVSLWMANGAFWAPGIASAEVTVTSMGDAYTKVVEGILKETTSYPIIHYLSTDNALTITDGYYVNEFFAAGYSDAAGAEVSGYTLTVNGEGVNFSGGGGPWYGGCSNNDTSGTANKNHVYFKKGSATNIIGGYGTTGAADNSVEISGGTVSTVHGGDAANGDAEGNTVTVKTGGTVSVSATGGFSNDSAATGNTVTVEGGTIGNNKEGNGVFGGDSFGGAADKNIVEISGGTINGSVYAGYGNTGASENEVKISGGTMSGHVYGGYVDQRDADTKTATGNIVTISGGTVNSSVIGGYVDSLDANATATGNIVMISNGTVNDGVTGGFASRATDNTVTISGGTVEAAIYGGQGRTEASGNTVTITGGELNVVRGGCGREEGSTAKGNKVEISGGTVNDVVTGGMGWTEASDNTVTISGDAKLAETAMISGGMAGHFDPTTHEWIPGTANNNTVNILKAIEVAHILGGDGATPTGNTLNIAATNVKVGTEGVVGFQNYNFYLPSTIKANDQMLIVDSTTATSVDGATIGAAVTTGAKLAKGDKVDLIVNTKGGVPGNFITTKLTTDKTATGLTVDTEYELEVKRQDANTIIAEITKAKEEENEDRTEEAKSLVETRAATTTFINAGADMLASQGFAQAANAVALEAAGVQSVGGFTPFAAFGGSGMRAESGSYVDTRGFGLNIGFARELPNSQGKLLFGPVVEYGGGSYDSYLDGGTHGEGGAHYFGIGVMARQVNHDGFYYEGSLRGGRVTSDYKADLDGVGRVDYDSASNYFAAHLGVGKAFNIGSGNTLDGYLKYFYSHQAGDTTTIHIAGMAEETGDFDAVDSNRIRIGARLTHKINEMNSLYGGLAYQYEFGGEARAHFNGNGVPSPSLKGSSGMLELGWQVNPGEGPMTLDLGVTGWAGKQRGGSVQLGATWSF